MTNQPEWKCIAQLGDVSPLGYGGHWVFVDTTGVYSPEAEKLITCDDDEDLNLVYRYCLDRLKLHNGMLIPYRYDETWPHPIERCKEWFSDDIPEVASFFGVSTDELQDLFCSVDPVDLAIAYEAIGEYFGFVNLDSDSLPYTKADVQERFNGPKYKVTQCPKPEPLTSFKEQPK